MGVGRELQTLGRYLDDCERGGDAVDSVDVAEVTGVADDCLTANLRVTLTVPATAGGVALCDPVVDDDGTVRFALESTTALASTTDHDVDAVPRDASMDGDTVTVTVGATVPGSASPNGSDSGSDDGGTPRRGRDGRETDCGDEAATESDDDTRPVGRSRDGVPPFKDRELLAEVYEACDTFAEMAETLDMDVTGETVRRYMMQHDIHEPTSYQTRASESDDGDDSTAADDAGDPDEARDGASEEPTDATPETESDDGDRARHDRTGGPGEDGADHPVALSDGIGLPEGVTVDHLIETVRRSNTIYEVKRDVEVDREDALAMLRDLNLLDLVVGQLSTETGREITRQDVVDRLREASAVN